MTDNQLLGVLNLVRLRGSVTDWDNGKALHRLYPDNYTLQCYVEEIAELEREQ